MPLGYQPRLRLCVQARIDACVRRAAVHARRVYRRLRPHPEVNHLDDLLRYAIRDAPAPRRAHRHADAAAVHHQRRRHIVQRQPARRDRVDAPRNRVKPHHPVVHNHASPLGNNARPETRHYRVRDGNRVALPVYHAQMRCAVVNRRPTRRQHALRLPALLHPRIPRLIRRRRYIPDSRPPPRRVFIRHQPIPWHIRESRIRQILEPVRVCQPRARYVGVQHISRVMPHRRHIEPVQQLQRHSARSPRAGIRRHAHRAVPILELQPAFPHNRLVPRHIILRQYAAVSPNIRGYRARHVALIESVRAALAYRSQHIRQIRLLQNHAIHHIAARHIPARHNHAPQLVIAQQHPAHPAYLIQPKRVWAKPFPRQPNRRRHHLAQRQLAKPPMRLAQPAHRARRRDRLKPLYIGVARHARPPKRPRSRLARQLIHIRLSRQRPLHRKADNAALLAHLIHQIAAPADAARRRLHHPHRQARRHRRVYRVPSRLQHLQPRSRGFDILSGDHCARRIRLILDYPSNRRLQLHSEFAPLISYLAHKAYALSIIASIGATRTGKSA